MTTPQANRNAIFGGLSLIALGVAVLIGIGMTMFIASRTEEMASFGTIAGIGFGFIASIGSFILALIGIWRKEKPRTLAFLGFILSAIPAAIGFWILVQLFARIAGL